MGKSDLGNNQYKDNEAWTSSHDPQSRLGADLSASSTPTK